MLAVRTTQLARQPRWPAVQVLSLRIEGPTWRVMCFYRWFSPYRWVVGQGAGGSVVAVVVVMSMSSE